VFLNGLTNKFASAILGKGVVNSVIAEKGTFALKKYRRYRSRQKTLKREFSRGKSQLHTLTEVCLKSISPVVEPVALVSQIQRSGGTLLSQLFDGHPELHAHPHELKIGFPKKYIWPNLDLTEGPERWFEMLFEDIVIEHYKEGYRKDQKSEETFPFIFLPSLQKEIFIKQLSAVTSIARRDIFNAYMTSYFGAWLNNQNRIGEKKFITAFTPRLLMVKESLDSFFRAYPDGKLISIIRDPNNWFPSAQRHSTAKNKYGNLRHAMEQWNAGARAMVSSKENYGEKVCLIRFEDLIGKTEAIMRYLANFLGISFDPILLTATFNKAPIEANTSFTPEKAKIMTDTLRRYSVLEPEQLETINALCSGNYQQVLQNIEVF